MIKRWRGSLYLKLFLSFLATCVVFFVALALFWNSYFSGLFYKSQKELLQSRAAELTQVAKALKDNTLTSRELRFGMRLLARSINGEIWLADSKGQVVFSSSAEQEGKIIPRSLDNDFAEALKGGSGYSIGHLDSMGGAPGGSFLTYYKMTGTGAQGYIAFLHTPVTDISAAISAVRMNIWIPLLFSLLAVGSILYILSRRLAGPLQQMNRASLALAEGDFHARVKVNAEDEIGQLARSFNFMAEQLEQWEETRQEFLANVSHELRSPLTSLRGLIAAMNDKLVPEDQVPRILKICDEEVQRLQRLVSDILELAKIQNSTDVFRLERISAIPATKAIIDRLVPVVENKGLQLEVWVPDEAGPQPEVVLDADRYVQIIHNLMYNAIKFTPAGQKIIVRLGSDSECFELSVKDTGIGMSEEDVKRIWDRFFKADPSRGTTADSEGTGLGLTITRHLVAGMKGTIGVVSAPGEGTEFTVRFPLAVVLPD